MYFGAKSGGLLKQGRTPPKADPIKVKPFAWIIFALIESKLNFLKGGDVITFSNSFIWEIGDIVLPNN